MGALTRRDVLRGALAAPVAAMCHQCAYAAAPQGFPSPSSPEASAFGTTGSPLPQVRIRRAWDGRLCRSHVVNQGREAVRVKEVALFDVAHDLPPATRFYGEGFQMLTQTGGTLGEPADLGNYTDPKHYRLPQPEGARTVYGAMSLQAPSGEHHLLAFTSCRRFSGHFHVRPGRVQVVCDIEGLELKPGEDWALEEFTYARGPSRAGLLSALADRLEHNHRRLQFPSPPGGWCSWYCFGPRVTAQNVRDNLEVIARSVPDLRYIQIDDGYQPAMGDWLETGAAFGGNVQSVLKEIRARGFEPAIWVAPFIAEAGSNVLGQHPDWFVKDAAGAPLRADTVTFGGWRRGPWYALDGTHPEARAHLERVFGTMRREWGCTYFKLDANFWGAIHGGRFHDPRATRIEAYRRGMQAILRGAGDAFILGCNHPIWPSLGLIHGARSSNDIRRTWARVATTARQNLMRNWQNGRLWWNDPDAVVLTGTDLTDDEFRFHATAIYATGGMMLSGDDLTTIAPERLAMLRKLVPATGVAARYEDDSLRVGVADLGDRQAVCLLNFEDTAERLTYTLPGPRQVRELWTDEVLGVQRGRVTAVLPPHSGKVLVCSPV